MFVQKKPLLKVMLWTICGYHVLLGIIPFLPEKATAQYTQMLFGMDIVATAQVSYMAKLFAMYAGIFGVFMGLAATDPDRYRPFIRWASLLFLARFLTNLLLFDYLRVNFSMSPLRIWQCISMIIFFGLGLFVFSGWNDDRE